MTIPFTGLRTLGALQIDLRLRNLLLSRVNSRFRLKGTSFIDLLLLDAARKIGEAAPSLGLEFLHVQVSRPLL